MIYSRLIWLTIFLIYIIDEQVIATLRDKSELTFHCYHFPGKDFGKQNNVKLTYGSSPHVLLDAGSQAIDFTLADLNVSPSILEALLMLIGIVSVGERSYLKLFAA